MLYAADERLKSYLDTNQLAREQMCLALLRIDKRFTDVRPAAPAAMSPMRLLRFHDGGSRDRMGYQQVVHFRNLQTADFISNLTHSVESRMLYPNSVIA